MPSHSNGAEQSAHRAALIEALAAKDRALDSGKAEDWTRTLELLRRADAIQTAAVTKYEIALAAAHLDAIDLALENYEAAIALGLPEKASERAREYILSHLTRVAQLELEGPSGTQIVIGGAERGRIPLAQFLYAMPGLVTIEGVFPDGQRAQRSVTLAAGHLSRVIIEPDEREPTADDGQRAIMNANRISPEAERASRRDNTSSVTRTGVNAPMPKSHPPSLRRTGWTLAATGATVAIISAVFIPIASSKVSSSRDALRNACDVQVDGPDTCAHSKLARWQEAQSASNAIATWKMARTVSWVGLVTGLAVTLGGTTMMLRSEPRDARPTTAWRFSLGPQQVQVSYAADLW